MQNRYVIIRIVLSPMNSLEGRHDIIKGKVKEADRYRSFILSAGACQGQGLCEDLWSN